MTRIEKIIVVVLCLLPRGTHGRLARQPIRAAGKDDGVPAEPRQRNSRVKIDTAAPS
jgi:hypothetical protein